MSLQHPEFDRFKRANAEARHQDALRSLDALLAEHPQSMALHWHRAHVLIRLERIAEARTAVEEVLRRRPDYVPALIKRVELDVADDGGEDDATLGDAERERRQRLIEAEEVARARRHQQWLREALRIDPDAVGAMCLLASLLQRQIDADPQAPAVLQEAQRLLARAIELAPDRIDLREQRGNDLRLRAMQVPEQGDVTADGDTIIVTFAGMRYARGLLERALADFQHCVDRGGELRHGTRVASLLHDLGRFDEALGAYDQVLAKLPVADPRREFIVDMRARSENKGAGERDQMARLLESAVAEMGPDRNQSDDMAAQALLSAANAVRGGKSLGAALEQRLSDDPEMLMANNIAIQILNVANEPAPELIAADPASFPGFQRRFNQRQHQALLQLGLRAVGDAEAKGITRMLGQRVLIGFFADESGETGVATFTMKPRWPGIIGFLLMLLTGKWKAVEMIECVSQFDDGAHLSTQYESISAFQYAAPVHIEKLPRRASLTELVTRHSGRVAEHRRAHPGAQPMQAQDLAGMERRWIEGQQAKKAYRALIGYITDAELKALLGPHYNRFARKVRERVESLAEDLQHT